MHIWKKTNTAQREISFLLFDRFSNLALANLLEPLRAANDLLGREAYRWHILTPDNGIAHTSSGLAIMPTARIGDQGRGDMLFVVSSYDHLRHSTLQTSKILRSMSGRYQVMAAVDSGCWLLGAAELLEGCRATIHFDLQVSFSERFEGIEVVRDRWVRDGDRITCSGGMAAFELACALIQEDHGAALLVELTQLFMSENVNTQDALSHIRADKKVNACLRDMETHIEVPLPIPEIANRAGLRQKDLEQRFNRHFGASPQKVYRRLRLNAAKRMLSAGGISIAEVALRAGYNDASAFARAFKVEFDQTPQAVLRGLAR